MTTSNLLRAARLPTRAPNSVAFPRHLPTLSARTTSSHVPDFRSPVPLVTAHFLLTARSFRRVAVRQPARSPDNRLARISTKLIDLLLPERNAPRLWAEASGTSLTQMESINPLRPSSFSAETVMITRDRKTGSSACHAGARSDLFAARIAPGWPLSVHDRLARAGQTDRGRVPRGRLVVVRDEIVRSRSSRPHHDDSRRPAVSASSTGPAPERHSLRNDIPRRAGGGIDDGAGKADECIEQAALADVGAAGDHDPPAVQEP